RILGLESNQAPPDLKIDRAALRALAAWATADEACSTNPRPDLWKHCDFGEPKKDFRLNLFPRLDATPVVAIDGGNGKIGLSFRTGGWGRLLDSSMEVEV